MANEQSNSPSSLPIHPGQSSGNTGSANGGFPPANGTVPSPTPVPSPNFATPPAKPSK